MRLFIGISLDEGARERAWQGVKALREQAERGSFTRRDNLHLTLAFIGETHRADGLVKMIETIRMPPFQLTCKGLGAFRRREGDICWMGIGDSQPLQTLHRKLSERLGQAGFPVEERPFRPHLTLGRKVQFPKTFQLARFGEGWEPFIIEVSGFSLMESRRVEGVLSYPILHTTKWEAGQ